MKAIFLVMAGFFLGAEARADNSAPSPAPEVRPLVFTGGYDTDPRDRGRPVVLIAAALKVTPEVFRQAFRGVHPAPPGESPSPERARANKEVLMAALGPYGVTNDRLNEVSNQYRYRRESGELWRHRPAAGFATMAGGKITGITLTDPGCGYSSPPQVSIAGMEQVALTAELHFDADFQKNGSIGKIVVAGAAPAGG